MYFRATYVNKYNTNVSENCLEKCLWIVFNYVGELFTKTMSGNGLVGDRGIVLSSWVEPVLSSW